MKLETLKKDTYRVTLDDGTVRTGDAGQTLALLRRAIGDVDLAIAQCGVLIRWWADIEKSRLLHGHKPEAQSGATQPKADLKAHERARADIAAAIDQVEQAAMEDTAAALRQQSTAAIARVVAALPTIPEEADRA